MAALSPEFPRLEPQERPDPLTRLLLGVVANHEYVGVLEDRGFDHRLTQVVDSLQRAAVGRALPVWFGDQHATV
jgi:uncharacterized membrane protein